MHSLTLDVMDRMSPRTLCIGKASHSRMAICSNWANVVVLSTCLYTCCFSASQACSMGFKSGDEAGHSVTFTPFWAKWFCTTLAVCALALSCWKMKFALPCWAIGSTCGLIPSNQIGLQTSGIREMLPCEMGGSSVWKAAVGYWLTQTLWFLGIWQRIDLPFLWHITS